MVKKYKKQFGVKMIDENIGKKFNKLIVIKKIMVRKKEKYKCLCDCGQTINILCSRINNPFIKSCGCFLLENGEMAYPKRKLPKNGPLRSAKNLLRIRYIDKGMREEDKIKIDDFLKLTKQNCKYCNTIPFTIYNWAKDQGEYSSQYAKDNSDYIYNGLDRIDSSKGHTLDNVVPCCKFCNWAKRERSVEEFKDWVLKICTKHNL